MQRKPESIYVIGAARGLQTQCHAFRIAIFTPGAYFSATGTWIPRRFSPFYFRLLGHPNLKSNVFRNTMILSVPHKSSIEGVIALICQKQGKFGVLTFVPKREKNMYFFKNFLDFFQKYVKIPACLQISEQDR
jgi:hypothetical protein